MADGGLDGDATPTVDIDVRETFGIDADLTVKGFAEPTDRVPDRDPTYRFDRDTTLAILAGFTHNRRVMVRAITAPASPPTSSRWRRGSTGPASG